MHTCPPPVELTVDLTGGRVTCTLRAAAACQLSHDREMKYRMIWQEAAAPGFGLLAGATLALHPEPFAICKN